MLTTEEMREIRQVMGRLTQLSGVSWSTTERLAAVGALAKALNHIDIQAGMLRRAYALLEDWAGEERQLREEIAAAIAVEGGPQNG